jgi:hypothetical protein
MTLTALLLTGGAAEAYDQKIHVYLSRRAYGGPAQLQPEESQAAKALRERVWQAGAESTDAERRRRFLMRYPDLAHFDAWEWKRFLGLNPDKAIAGLDDAPLPAGDDAREVYAQASRLPDDDHRNRERYRHDAQRQVVRDPYGRPLPEDPATLEMGGLDGLSSQAHAHYGLPRIAFSDDPDVLKKDPRRFAIPPTVHTFGAEYAEMYTDLSVLAASLPGGSRLSLMLAGAGAHHIQDVANQIHTVQVGVYDFFVDAKLESLKEELRSVGGILRPRPTFVAIGIDIIANHHTLLEYLFGKHLFTPGDPVQALAEKAAADPTLAASLEQIPPACAPGFGRAVTEQVIDRSSFEGAPVYAAIRQVAVRSLSRVGHHFDETDDPDRYIKPGADLANFYDLETRGARRADQASLAWWKRFQACAEAGPAVTGRFADALIRDRLDALDAADARARAFVPKPPLKAEIAWWVPAFYVAVVVLGYGAIHLIRRRRRGAG